MGRDGVHARVRALLLLGGRIADYTGRKRIFVFGLLGFAVASALGGIASNQELLFAACALQGAFAALMAPAAPSLITVTFTEPKERAKAFGVFGALSAAAPRSGSCQRRPHRARLLALVPRRQRPRRVAGRCARRLLCPGDKEPSPSQWLATRLRWRRGSLFPPRRRIKSRLVRRLMEAFSGLPSRTPCHVCDEGSLSISAPAARRDGTASRWA